MYNECQTASALSFAMQHVKDSCGAYTWVFDDTNNLVQTNAPLQKMACKAVDTIAQSARDACATLCFPYFWKETSQLFYASVIDMNGRLYGFGPMSVAHVNDDEMERYATDHQFEQDQLLIPAVTASLAANCSAVFCYLLTGIGHPLETIYHINTLLCDLFMGHWAAYRMDALEQQRLPYTYEQQWIENVFSNPAEYFSPNSLRERQNLEAYVGKLAETPLKQTEYQIVTAIALATRAAMRFGLDPVESYILSDNFYQQLAECTTREEMQDVYIKAMAALAGRAQHERASRLQNGISDRCKQYVDANLCQPMSVEIIAKAIGVSRNHLSSVFSRDNGKTLTRYIHEKRMDRASELLRYTSMEISEIAATLTFSSQSYFGSLFKQHFGMTPQKYRNRYGIHATSSPKREMSEN